MEVGVALALRMARLVCASCVRRFSAARAAVATSGWTVPGKQLSSAGVDIQVYEGIFEAVFETFLTSRPQPSACPDRVLLTVAVRPGCEHW